LSPAFLERAEQSEIPALKRFAVKWRPVVEKALLWIIALGILLPTMHQSSLGALMLIAGPRLHPLWNTGWLPLLFLMSCIAMGYAAVVFEAAAVVVAVQARPGARDAGRPQPARSSRSGRLRLAAVATTSPHAASWPRCSRSIVYSVMSLVEFALWSRRGLLLERGPAPRSSEPFPRRDAVHARGQRSTASTPTWWRSARAPTGRISRASARSWSPSG
jgi:hypothetical protein